MTRPFPFDPLSMARVLGTCRNILIDWHELREIGSDLSVLKLQTGQHVVMWLPSDSEAGLSVGLRT